MRCTASCATHRWGSAAHLRDVVRGHPGDVRDPEAIAAAVQAAAPDEVYHLASETQPGRSAEDPERTLDVVAGGTERLLDAVARHAPGARVFCASSSEVFGEPDSAPQDEQTSLRPSNPYGEAKAEALLAARERRERQSQWVATGIFYNHESVRRPLSFVTRKITWHAAAIAAGEAGELRLGNLDARRDWGYAPEFVEGAWRTMQADEPGDYVFATGVLHSVRELLETAFGRAGVAVDGHVVVDEKLVRDDPRAAGRRPSPSKVGAGLGGFQVVRGPDRRDGRPRHGAATRMTPPPIS